MPILLPKQHLRLFAFVVAALAGCSSPPTQQEKNAAPTPVLTVSPHFTVVDRRNKEELEGSTRDYGGNTYEVVGDNSISPSLQLRLVARVDALVGEQGKGKTLEIIRTRVSTQPDPRGISTRQPNGTMPIGVEVIGRLIWKGIDRATYGRNITVGVQGTYDGMDFYGSATGSYRSDIAESIDSLAGTALEAAMKNLSAGLAARSAPAAPSPGEPKPGT